MNVKCPKCAKVLSIRQELFGTLVQCPCGQQLRIQHQKDGLSPNANLIACDDCGVMISKNAVACPRCGSPRSSTNNPTFDFKSVPTSPPPSYFPSTVPRTVEPHTSNQSTTSSRRRRPANWPNSANADKPPMPLCTTSAVLSLLGLFCLGPILAPIALLLAFLAIGKDEPDGLKAVMLAVFSILWNVGVFFCFLFFPELNPLNNLF